MSPAQPFTGCWSFSLQDCTGLFQHSGKDRKPWLQHICCKKKFYRPTQTPIFGTRLEVNLLERRFAVDLSKKAKQQRQKRVNASCSCFCLPSFTLGSCQAEAVQVEGWLRAERCGAGPRKSGGAGGQPGQGGAGKQRATPPPSRSCRDGTSFRVPKLPPLLLQRQICSVHLCYPLFGRCSGLFAVLLAWAPRCQPHGFDTTFQCQHFLFRGIKSLW